jgi:hypothetical protein
MQKYKSVSGQKFSGFNEEEKMDMDKKLTILKKYRKLFGGKDIPSVLKPKRQEFLNLSWKTLESAEGKTKN